MMVRFLVTSCLVFCVLLCGCTSDTPGENETLRAWLDSRGFVGDEAEEIYDVTIALGYGDPRHAISLAEFEWMIGESEHYVRLHDSEYADDSVPAPSMPPPSGLIWMHRLSDNELVLECEVYTLGEMLLVRDLMGDDIEWWVSTNRAE